MTEPVITTVIPTYRRPELLKRALKSVLNQTYRHLQVCVYDNNSEDETSDVVAEFARNDHRVKYHCHSKNIGAMNNFLYGMERANTDFFSLLSDDDILLPDFYKMVLDKLASHPAAIFAATQVITLNSKGIIAGRVPDFFPPGFYSPPIGFQTMVKYGPPTWTGILFKKEILTKVGLPDPIIGWPADYEYEYRIASKYSYLILAQPGAIFVHHELSATKSGLHVLDFPSGRLEILRRVKHDYGLPPNIAREAIAILKKRHIKALTNIALKASYNKDTNNRNRAIHLLEQMYCCRTRSCICRLFAIFLKNYWFRNLLTYYLKYMKGKSRAKLLTVQRRYGDYAKHLRN